MNETTGLRNRPWRLAATVAGLYGLVSMAYIHTSTQIAASLAPDTATFQRIEELKGTGYILVMTLLLFLGLHFLFSRLKRHESVIQGQDNALKEAEQRATAGIFASSVAHDLNNVLVISRSCVGELRESADLSADSAELLRELDDANEQIRDCVGRLSQFREMEGEPSWLDLSEIVTRATVLAQSHDKVRYCNLESELPPGLTARVEAAALHRAVLNMIINAADATDGHGRIRTELKREGENISLEVHDNGPGIAPKERSRITEPFYTTKPDGSGLGFVSLRHCARTHGGTLELTRSSSLGGACVRILIPRTGPSSSGTTKDSPEYRAHQVPV